MIVTGPMTIPTFQLACFSTHLEITFVPLRLKKNTKIEKKTNNISIT